MQSHEHEYRRLESIIDAANEQIRALEASLIKAKGIPMKYKRMEFNAQLQDENSSLRTALTAERAISDKLEKALKVAKAFCDGLTAEECPDTIALPISAALAEVAALRKKENA